MCLMTDDPEMHKRHGYSLVAMQVDDHYLPRNEEALDEMINLVKKSGFNVTVEDDLMDYLSCNIIFDKERKQAWLGPGTVTLDQKSGK